MHLLCIRWWKWKCQPATQPCEKVTRASSLRETFCRLLKYVCVRAHVTTLYLINVSDCLGGVGNVSKYALLNERSRLGGGGESWNLITLCCSSACMCAFLCAKSDTSHSPPPQFKPWQDFIAAGCQRATECHTIAEPDGNLAGLFGSPWWRLPPPPAIVRPCSIKIGPVAYVLSAPRHDGLHQLNIVCQVVHPPKRNPDTSPNHAMTQKTGSACIWYDEAHADNKKNGFCTHTLQVAECGNMVKMVKLFITWKGITLKVMFNLCLLLLLPLLFAGRHGRGAWKWPGRGAMLLASLRLGQLSPRLVYNLSCFIFKS